MGGKAGLIAVVGFGFILAYISRNLNAYGTHAVANMATYQEATASHNLALAGANVGLSKLYQDTTWRSSISQTLSNPGMHGSFTVGVTDLGSRLRLRSVSQYASLSSGNIRDTVDVYFSSERRNSFSLFAWMTNNEGGVYWYTGDTVWGRVHTNGTLYVYGRPVFWNKITTSRNFSTRPGRNPNYGIYKQGYETGVARIELPSDISELVTASVSGGRRYVNDIWVTLDGGTSTTGDGKVYVRQTQTGPVIDTVNLSDPTFNGVLLGTGRVNVQGTLDGRLSIASLTDIYIQNDIVYEQNPMTGPSDDLLGLVADRNVVVADNTPNRSDCRIDGSVFARSGSFTAENYSSRPISGNLYLLGSIVQDDRGAIGTFSGSSMRSGFSKRYRYDDRLADIANRPPSYPGFFIRTYCIANWWESYRVSDWVN